MKILVADDDAEIRDLIGYALRRSGFAVTFAADGREALGAWEREAPDVVLLDIRMPELDGLEVLRAIRLRSDTPVIMLTARQEETAALQAFQLGADDYIAKPFSPRVLVARIRTVSRRLEGEDPDRPTLVAAGVALDTVSNEVRRGALQARLTPIEARILRQLLLEASQIVTSNRLLEQIGEEGGASPTVLNRHIRRIRRRLGMRAGEPGYVETIRGVGYRLRM